ncbi:MAG: DUF86 domain-containing protein [Bryobacterales bacterium]|nr:DUF86 domain-containing protein [Bryobacterales bacterium]
MREGARGSATGASGSSLAIAIAIARVYLLDIREAIAKIRQYTKGLTREDMAADSKTLDPVVRNLEVIGEAVKMLPDEVRRAAPK